jgi:hypothetical protein
LGLSRGHENYRQARHRDQYTYFLAHCLSLCVDQGFWHGSGVREFPELDSQHLGVFSILPRSFSGPAIRLMQIICQLLVG